MLEGHMGIKGQGWGSPRCVREMFLLEEVKSEWSRRASRSRTGRDGESEGFSKPERVYSVCKE